MIFQIGKFKVYDLQKKEIIPGKVALTSYDDVITLSVNEKDSVGFYLTNGRRDRYVILPQIPTQIVTETFYAGDILSNGSDNLWVIKFDLMSGVYCTMIDLPNTYNKLESLLSFGCKKVGDIFTNPELLRGSSVEVFL